MASNIGKAPVGILARALTGNIFVKQNLAYMNQGDKDGYNAYKHDIKNVLRKQTKDPASDINNTSRRECFKRDLCVVESIESFCPSDYYQHWRDYQPEGNFQWETLPEEVQAVLEELFLGTSAEAAEDALTNGSTALGLTGLIPQLISPALTPLNGAMATPDQVVNNTAIAFRAHAGGTGDELAVELTTANVFQKMELLIKNQTKSMRKRAGRKFMVSCGTADLIKEAQRLELSFKGVDIYESGVMRYAGYDIIENPAFPDNTILFASMTGDYKTDAIQLGTSLSSDFMNLHVERLSNFSREWAMCLTFALDIFVVRPEEVAFYTAEETVV